MVVLDLTVVNIALAKAQVTLHFSNDDRQWVTTAYAPFGVLLDRNRGASYLMVLLLAIGMLGVFPFLV